MLMSKIHGIFTLKTEVGKTEKVTEFKFEKL